MNTIPDRNLSKREIDLVLHLMACGAGGLLPIKVLTGARPIAAKLWGLGIVECWSRQSLGGRRSEGPFYSLTPLGRERGRVFALARRNWTDEVHANHPRSQHVA